MSDRWIAHFYVWPYSGMTRGDTRKRMDHDEAKTRGARDPAVAIIARDFEDARKQAEAIMTGIMLDERVWQCGLQGLFQGELYEWNRERERKAEARRKASEPKEVVTHG